MLYACDFGVVIFAKPLRRARGKGGATPARASSPQPTASTETNLAAQWHARGLLPRVRKAHNHNDNARLGGPYGAGIKALLSITIAMIFFIIKRAWKGH